MAISGVNSNPRYRSLDGYRFIAASLVVLLHFHGEFGLQLGAATPVVTSLEVMVDFFFVLSGFVIAITYGKTMSNIADYGRFLQRRVARLYPLHLAVLSIFVGLAFANRFGWMAANHVEALDFRALPANILMLHAWGTVNHLSFNAGSWSISAEWLSYLLFPVLLLLSRRCSLAANLAVVVGTIGLLALWRDATGMRAWYEATYDHGALRALPTFFLGVVLAGLFETCPHALRCPWPVVHLVFLAAVVSLFLPLRIATIGLLALVVLLAAIAERNNKPSVVTSRLFGRLGDASYAIYMTHGVVAIPVVFVLRKFGALGTPLAAGAAIATYLAVLIAACCIYTYFETPARRWLTGLGIRQPAGRPAFTLQAAA
ncbi:MAG TPA: acyltransferase [Xanthobacteraceae bacterium]|jgi:peptidoglycan/LPS O-acetylase OafA/YrhL|nr:acyltransferase [Xanthobacteraceae bacterium]